MKKSYSLLLVTLLALAISGCTHLQKDKDVLFQTSTINALLEGAYDGEVTFKDLRQHGNFSIGTFNDLDGEMIGLGGKFYQIKADGIAYPVSDSAKTPFAVVTFFEADRTVSIDKSLDFKQLEEYLDNRLPTKNIFYAIKIEGAFSYVKTRSVPKQDKPYPPLVEAVKDQTTFEFSNARGTIVGFYCPAYVAGINVGGYHFHFITEDRKRGGHLLECQIQNVKVEIDETSKFYMVLPQGEEFGKLDLQEKKQKELDEVER